MSPRRILVYGVTGSGKSTLAREIARRSGLPYIAVDDLTWEPNWSFVDGDEQRRRIGEVCAGDAWVLDGAYATWRDLVMPRVELVIGLDYPRWLSLGRLLRRCAANILLRRTLCNGNRESVRNLLSRKSIIVWHFQSWANKRRRMRAWAAEDASFEIVLHRSPRATRAWLEATFPR